ncbi:hypothetical protein OS493_012341 [Desmophyllum pertusum]|uniref:CxC5 like cysteine cluster associated with KDZ domain-containing protein n=1 Tax=Desmophyllum pertusum TaxID=174260 RepID=A0A9X0D532_9CNID|nr:hypothetical protein OS493_012341 [Desmophyllum pertusum]
MVGELTRTITKDELRVIVELLRRCEDFLEFSFENSVSTIAINAAIPIQRILYPPVQLCLRCGWTLQLQSQPAIVTVFENHETFPGMKFSLKCRNCNIHYGYSMYGSGEDGYRFYPKRRPYVESSNVTYLARDLCLQQEVRVICIFWHEMEEFRGRKIDWCFKGSDSDAMEAALAEIITYDKEDCINTKRKTALLFVKKKVVLISLLWMVFGNSVFHTVCGLLKQSSESPSQAFLLAVHYLYLRLKNVPPTQWPDFNLSYDNMCNVDKMKAAKEALPLEAPYDKLWLSVTKVIDLLHLQNHKNEQCHKLFNPEVLKIKFPKLTHQSQNRLSYGFSIQKFFRCHAKEPLSVLLPSNVW